MLQRLRSRAQGSEGFTLIELLVVILIIGILAAVAIPTFLSQTSKANDSNIQSNLNTIQTAEATFNTTSGNYTGVLATLANTEQTINAMKPVPTLSLTAVPTGASDTNASPGTFQWSSTITNASTGTSYSISSYSDGFVADTCVVATKGNAGACNLGTANTSGTGNGTWGNGNA